MFMKILNLCFEMFTMFMEISDGKQRHQINCIFNMTLVKKEITHSLIEIVHLRENVNNFGITVYHCFGLKKK